MCSVVFSIITGNYLVGEWERVVYAARLLEKCPLYIQQLPDFSLQDIENTEQLERIIPAPFRDTLKKD